jgi:ketosteroid isomerase-like protein
MATFRQALHRHLQALERSDLHARLFATPLEIHEAADAAFAVLHLLYCEDAPGRPPLRQQSHLTLVFQRHGGKWVRVQDQDRLIR